MPNKKDPISRIDDKPQSRKELEEKRYDIGGPFGRIMLVRDAEGLSAREKSYLNVLATTCGGKGVDHDPALTFIGDHEVAAGSATSMSVVKAARRDLMSKDRLIIKRWQRDLYSWFTSVDWLKLREYSYKWQAMLRKEAEAKSHPAAIQPPAEITAEEQAVLDDLDVAPGHEKTSATMVKVSTNYPKPSATVTAPAENTSDLDDAAPKGPGTALRQESPKTFTFERDEPAAPIDDCEASSLEKTKDQPQLTLSYRGHVLLQALIEITLRSGAAFSGDYDRLTEDDEETVVEVCDKWGIEVAITSRGYRLTLPLHECASLRLTHASGKFIAPSNCIHLARKESEDHYAVMEYALATESWATIIRTVDSPIGLLMSKFSAIQESWIEHGRPDCEPPATEAVNYIVGLRALGPKARREWTREDRVELFKAQRAGDVDDSRVLGDYDADPDVQAFLTDPDIWANELRSQMCGWDLIADTPQPVQDDDWVDRTEAAVAQAFIAGES